MKKYSFIIEDHELYIHELLLSHKVKCYIISPELNHLAAIIEELQITNSFPSAILSTQEFQEKIMSLESNAVLHKQHILIQQIQYKILANLSDDQYSIESLAKDVGISRSTMHRALKKYCNKNSSSFIHEVKLNEARKMLQYSEMNIAEIAYATGYSSPSYFIKLFHKSYGFTPCVFRSQKK